MIEANLEDKVHWHNVFTPKYYISQAIGPEGMILCKEKTDYSNLKLDFGQYCQVYEKTKNRIMTRSVGGIALRHKNDRGLYYFMPLNTGRIIYERQ